MRVLVGVVTLIECKEIQLLHERKNSLLELAKILTVNDSIYEKVIHDLSLTNVRFSEWWDNMKKKYQWESKANSHWEINFENCNIYLSNE